MNHLCPLALAALSVAPLFAQTTEPTAVTGPVTPIDPSSVAPAIESESVPGLPLAPEAVIRTWTQTMAQVQERDAALEPPSGKHKLRNGRQGEWHTPSVKHKTYPHSGRKSLCNKWGDTSMGIGLGGTYDVLEVWVACQGGRGSWAEALRVVGYRDGEVVGSSDWFDDIDTEPSRMTIGLREVDRIVFEAKPSPSGAGFFVIDDLRIAGADSEARTIDFEDAPWDAALTGSDYLGFDWEEGTGSFEAPQTGIVPPPVFPGSGVPVTPTFGGSTMPAFGNLGTSPMPIQDFEGPMFGDNGAGFIPPDTAGAVGLQHFASVVNSNLSIYEKATGTRVVDVALDAFFGTGFVGDPRIAYDFADNRWAMLATDFVDNIVLAYSATSDPTGAWFMTQVRLTLPTTIDGFVDFPTLGVDSRGIFVGAFLVNQPSFAIFAFDKAPLLQATQSLGAVTAFRDLPTEGAIQHATQYTDAGASFMVSTFANPSMTIRRINEPLSSPTLTTTVLNIPAYGFPFDAPSMGSTTDVDTGDTRFVNACFAGGSLWAAHTIDVNGRAGARWYEVDPFAPALLQTGTVSDPNLAFFYPSIAADEEGRAVMGFSGTNTQQFVSTYYCGRVASDPAGAMSIPTLYASGLGPYTLLDSFGRNRWGDYSQTSLDPIDGTFWTIQERTLGTNFWGTRIQQLFHQDPCLTDQTRYCNAVPNPATGLAAAMFIPAGSSTSLSANDFALGAADVSPFAFGLFFFGANQAMLPAGDGTICVANPLFRLMPVAQADAFGVASLPVDLAALPLGAPSLQPGDRLNFSFWFRQATPSGFNFSDGINVQFCD